MLFYVVFLKIGGPNDKWLKSAMDHEKTFRKINKYKKKNLENLKLQKKVLFYEREKNLLLCL